MTNMTLEESSAAAGRLAPTPSLPNTQIEDHSSSEDEDLNSRRSFDDQTLTHQRSHNNEGDYAEPADATGDQDRETGKDSNGHVLHRVDTKPYSVFTHNEKRLIIFCAGVCSFLSPISAQIYFPALNQIAADLHVSYDLVNLTITTYLVSMIS